MWAIVKKDFKMLFYSPIGYIVLSIYLFIFGIIIYLMTLSNRSVDFNIAYNYMAWYGLPIITAVLAMRSFSEEKHKGTEHLLFSTGKRTISVVVGKWIAVSSVSIVATIISMFYCVLFMQYGSVDFRLLGVTLFGFTLLIFAYTSFGVLISSLTESQVISSIITLIFLLLPVFFSYGNGVFSYLSLISFFAKFAIGIISIKSIIVLISFSIACIILTALEIDRKRMLD